MSEDQGRPTLAVPRHALSAYLDSLLNVPEPHTEPLPEAQAVISPSPEDETDRAEDKPGVAADSAIVTQPASAQEQSKDGPEIRQGGFFFPTESFQALFLRVGKLNLAVPLVKLNGILKSEDIRITRVPGYAPWHLGLIRGQGITTNLVDTARLLLPEDRLGLASLDGEYRYFILIDEKCWALGCHSLADVVVLKPEEVKWRQSRTVRPWLAGTVIEKTCAILDVDGLVESLTGHAKCESGDIKL